MKYRVCRKCGEEFPLTAEYFHRAGNDFRHWCKECYNLSRRGYRKPKRPKPEPVQYRPPSVRRGDFNTKGSLLKLNGQRFEQAVNLILGVAKDGESAA